MKCSEARDALLIADLSDLRSDSAPLGAHVETCGRCRALAAAIVRDTAAIGVLVPRRPLAPRRRVTASRIALLVSLPMAAAIIAVAVLKESQPEPAAPPRSSRPVVRQVSLTVAPGQQAAVIKTPDPTITVIWLNQGGGQ